MALGRDDERRRALEMWRASGGQKKTTDIARELGVSASTVRSWRHRDGWQLEERGRKRCNARAGDAATRRRRGGQPGNGNARGPHAGGTLQPGSQIAVRHGAYSRQMMQHMRPGEAEIWTDESYAADALEAVRLELRGCSVQQLRLMTRLDELRRWGDALRAMRERLEDGEDVTSAEVMAIGYLARGRSVQSLGKLKPRALIETMISDASDEMITIEGAIERVTGRKTRLLEMLCRAEAEDKTQDVRVTFGAMPMPGTPEHDDIETR